MNCNGGVVLVNNEEWLTEKQAEAYSGYLAKTLQMYSHGVNMKIDTKHMHGQTYYSKASIDAYQRSLRNTGGRPRSVIEDNRRAHIEKLKSDTKTVAESLWMRDMLIHIADRMDRLESRMVTVSASVDDLLRFLTDPERSK